MINSLLSQLPPGTGVLCLSLAAALGWMRAARWKSAAAELRRNLAGRISSSEDDLEDRERLFRDQLRKTEDLRNAMDADLQQMIRSLESERDFLRTRLTELLPIPDSQSNWEHHAARLAVFERDLHDLREQVNNPPVVTSEPDDDDLPEVTREAVDPGHDYRILDPADIIEDGDEYRDGFWHTSCRAGQAAGTEFPYRRKVSPPAAPAQPGAPDPGEGWRLLADDEEIKDGDEYQTEGHDKWFFSGKAGFTPDEVRDELRGHGMKPCCYRRRVQPAADLWASAPADAQWRATDSDGSAWFYVEEPRVIERTSSWAVAIDDVRAATPDNVSARLPAPVTNWRDTLIRRPVKSDERV